MTSISFQLWNQGHDPGVAGFVLERDLFWVWRWARLPPTVLHMASTLERERERREREREKERDPVSLVLHGEQS
jgi:DNA segregation ATPase FtsK/SpoIIIE-like protein